MIARLRDATLALIAPVAMLVLVPEASSQTPLSYLPENPPLEEAMDYGMLGNVSFDPLLLPQWPLEADETTDATSALQFPGLARVLEQLSDSAGIGGPGSAVQVFEVPDTLSTPDQILWQKGFSPSGQGSFDPGYGGLFQLPPSLGGNVWVPQTTGGSGLNIPAAFSQAQQQPSRICPAPKTTILVVKELPDHFKVGNRTVAVFNSQQEPVTIGVEIDGAMQPFVFAAGEFMAFVVADGAAAFGEVHTETKGLDRRPLRRGSVYSVAWSAEGKYVFSEIRHGNQ